MEPDGNLWEVFRQWQQMQDMKAEKAWAEFLALPDPDDIFTHDLFIGEERTHLGTYLILIYSTAHEVKRWRLKGKVE